MKTLCFKRYSWEWNDKPQTGRKGMYLKKVSQPDIKGVLQTQSWEKDNSVQKMGKRFEHVSQQRGHHQWQISTRKTLTSPAKRELQIETAVRCYTPWKEAKMKRGHSNSRRGGGATGTLTHAGGDVKWDDRCGKQLGSFLKSSTCTYHIV